MKTPSYLQGFTCRIGDCTTYECNGRIVICSHHNSRPSACHSPAQLLQRARWSNSVNLWCRFPCEKNLGAVSLLNTNDTNISKAECSGQACLHIAEPEAQLEVSEPEAYAGGHKHR